MYVITDGEENYSQAHLAKVRRLLVARGVRFFAFLMRSKNPGVAYAEISRDDFRRLAIDTEGMVINYGYRRFSLGDAVEHWDQGASTKGFFAAASQMVSQQMRNYYRLQIQSSAADREWRWKLDVVDQDGRTRKGVDLMYPRQLLPCTYSRASGEANTVCSKAR